MAKNTEKEAKFECPNCHGIKGLPVFNGSERVKGQTRCANKDCQHVLTEE